MKFKSKVKNKSENKTSRIEELVKQKEALNALKQFNEDRKNEINSKYEIKIDKYRNKAFKIKGKCDNANCEIARELKRIDKLIELEREQANSIADMESIPEVFKK